MTFFSNILAVELPAFLPTFIRNNPGPVAFVLIVVLGLLVLGFRDVRRFSFVRTWAISTVCFQQAIRRRILWMTPVVILGVMLVSQFARPIDAQDDIRQTIKFCLFATGLLLTLVMIILACTNLPNEIETRVIYTVATKPTTRFEIVVGKVLGFARVSAAILILMGLFSFAYLHFKDWRLRQRVDAELNDSMMLVRDPARRQTLEYYRSAGLLHARVVAAPGERNASPLSPYRGLSIYAIAPTQAMGGEWSLGGGEQLMLVPFDNFIQRVPDELRRAITPDGTGFGVSVKVAHRPLGATQPSAPTTAPTEPGISLMLLNQYEAVIATGDLIRPSKTPPQPVAGEDAEIINFDIDAKAFDALRNAGPRLYLSISGLMAGRMYAVRGAAIIVPQLGPENALIKAEEVGEGEKARTAVYWRARLGTAGGQQLRGDADGRGPVALYRFVDAPVSGPPDGQTTLEFRVGVERGGSDQDVETDDPTRVELMFVNTVDRAYRHRAYITTDHNRPVYLTVPTKALGDGKFWVQVKCLTNGHWLTLRDGPRASLRVVVEQQWFAWNLFKSMAILWFMSVLVVIVGLFCSTFVSWPIAIVLSSVILMGYWGANQLELRQSDTRGVIGEIFGKNVKPAQAQALDETLQYLNKFLNLVTALLPDISRFAAVEAIESGQAVPRSVMLSSATVAFGFGIPLMVLTYVLLRYKEVAP